MQLFFCDVIIKPFGEKCHLIAMRACHEPAQRLHPGLETYFYQSTGFFSLPELKVNIFSH